MSTDRHYDAIVIGGGHNGLTNGAYLAKAGLRTLILERRHLVGGAAITEELYPGFHFTTFSYALSLLRPDIIHELELTKHGFLPLVMPNSFCPTEDGDYLLMGPDRNENLNEIARHSPRDADAFERYEHDITMVAQAVKPLFDKVPPNILGTTPEDLAEMADLARHLRGLEPGVLHNLVRLLTGSAADFLDAYFETDLIKAWLASSGIIGSKVGPMSQGSGLVLLFHNMGEHDGIFGKWAFHKGGNGGFTQVLARAATAFGAEIRTDSTVERVITSNGRATGVALEDGTELTAGVVVSAADPHRTFTRFVDPRELPTDLVDALRGMGDAKAVINRKLVMGIADAIAKADGETVFEAEDLRVALFRYQGVSSKVNFALDGLPPHPTLEGGDHLRGFTNVAPDIEYLERAFDAAKYGWYSPSPYIDGAVQSTVDPDMAPPGKHVMSCFVQYTPYHLKGGDWETERQNLGDTVQSTLERFFPGFGDRVLHREVVTPLDIEQVAGLPEGNIFHGEFLAPQMYFFRPAPGWNQYRTPIAGYYQCGSGTHPGGCVMGAPARLASQQILKDLGR